MKMITQHDEITEEDVSINYKNETVIINTDVTVRALYSYFIDTISLDYSLPICVAYVCDCCGHANWTLKSPWEIDGQSHIKTEFKINDQKQ